MSQVGNWQGTGIFIFPRENTESPCRQYHGLSISRSHTTADKLGVLCTWFVTSDYRHFEQCDSTNSTTPILHEFIPISSYLCTLPFELLHLVDTPLQSAATSLITSPYCYSGSLRHPKKFIIDAMIKHHIDDIMMQALSDNTMPTSNLRKRKKTDNSLSSSSS